MSVILVVDRDADRVERISAALRHDGLSVTTAASRAEAMHSAEARAPALLLASSTLPEANALLADFSRRSGGPGAVVMVEDRGASPEDFQADLMLAEPFTDDELRRLVQQCLKPAADARPDAPDSGNAEQLTSADIFGDVLAEVEAEARGTRPTAATRKPSAPKGDIERRLEETLSGVIPITGKSRRTARVPGQRDKAGKRRSPELPTETEIDDLLDQTLSSLDIPTRSKKSTPVPPREKQRGGIPAAPLPEDTDTAVPAASAEAPATLEPAAVPSPGHGASADGSLAAATPVEPAFDATPPPAEPTFDATPPPAEPTFDATPPPAEPTFDATPPPAEPTFDATPPPAEPTFDATPPPAEPIFDATPPPAEPTPDAAPPPAEPTFDVTPPPAPMPSSVPEDLQAEANQFRTQALSTLDLAAEIAAETSEGEAFGDYTLLDRIATGGMAEVWRARRRGVEGFQKTVAIKKILSHLTGSQDFIKMFIDEAKLAAQLSHNNIIQIYDLGKVGDDFFIAMEHVDGKDLRSILTAAQDSNRPIPMGLALLIVSAVAQALDYAHRKRDFDNRAMGLVHRDVSPQNVMISYEGAIKLCDFGIVKAVAKASTTQMGALKGKLQYMSPEQAWGKSVDARSDIFSLGSVLYEVLTGNQLFSGESEIGVLDAVRECQIGSPREIVPAIPEEVARIVLRALAKSPDERFQTAGELEHEIRAVLDNLRPTPSQKDLSAYLHTLFETPKSGAVALPAPGTATTAEPSFMPPAAEGPAAGAPAAGTPIPGTPTEAAPAAAQPAAEGPTAEPAAEGPIVDRTPTAGTGRWKWLAAAVLAIALIGAALLVLPKLLQRDAAVPDSAPAPQVEAAPPAPAVSPTPLEDTAAEAAGDLTGETGIAEGDTAGDLAAAAATDDPAAGATADPPAEADPAVTAAGIDIEQMVNEELTNRAEQLRRDFEAEKKRIEEELARTQQQSREAEEDGKDDGGGEGDG